MKFAVHLLLPLLLSTVAIVVVQADFLAYTNGGGDELVDTSGGGGGETNTIGQSCFNCDCIKCTGKV